MVCGIMEGMNARRTAPTYAVVDLEATGTGSDARIIQIGIVMVEGGQVTRRFATDINPHVQLDSHIIQLTGITDQQLAAAPDFSQVAATIMDWIGEAVFVAHNVTFDANLLAEALFFEGYELRTPRVDTVELSQLVFPTLDKYSLSNLSQQLNLGLVQAHTALSDAEATAALLLAIREEIGRLPKGTVEQVLQLADHLLYESRLVIEEVYSGLDATCPANLEQVHGLAVPISLPSPSPCPFSGNFAADMGQLGLTPRPQQAAFAQLVSQRLDEEGQVHFLEAQAGSGKTYGYLLPLLAKGNQPLLVSVPTKVLQEQIVANEGQALEQAFGIQVTALKAPRHYIKLDRFWAILQEESPHRLVNQCKMQVLVWLCQTQTGDLTELKQRYRYPSFFEEIAHDGQLDATSLFGQWDFWWRLQAKALQSQVIVTNHAYLLHHLGEYHPLFEGRILVLDEVQKLLLTAEDLSRTSLSLTQLLQTLQSKKDRTSDLLTQRLYESCLFEVSHLVARFRKTRQSDVPVESLATFCQHLVEVKDRELEDWVRLLTDDVQLWLEEQVLDGQMEVLLRGSREGLFQLAPLLPQTKTFCISATLDISPQVSLADLLGFEEVTVDRVAKVAQTNQLLLLPQRLPPLQTLSRAAHAQLVVDWLRRLQPLGRPMVVLFTSLALLNEVSERLEQLGIAHLAQHKHGQEASLKRRFERGEVAMLLGAGAFWEGVDFASQKEQIQIVTRLPFDNPKDRLTQKLTQHLEDQGKRPFSDYALPMMGMRLRQALGRLNRSIQQTSAVLLLDSRLESKGYGRQLLASLGEERPCRVLPVPQIGESIAAFFDEHR